MASVPTLSADHLTGACIYSLSLTRFGHCFVYFSRAGSTLGFLRSSKRGNHSFLLLWSLEIVGWAVGELRTFRRLLVSVVAVLVLAFVHAAIDLTCSLEIKRC
jgi:hypothetical protein